MNNPAIEIFDERARDLLSADATLEKLATGCIWSEGASGCTKMDPCYGAIFRTTA
jgi:hypothetical protein